MISVLNNVLKLKVKRNTWVVNEKVHCVYCFDKNGVQFGTLNFMLSCWSKIEILFYKMGRIAIDILRLTC